MLEGAAVLEEVAVRDAVDPDVGGVADLVVRAQGLRVVWSAIAAHEVKLSPAEVALDLRQDAQEAGRHRPPVTTAVAEKARERRPRAPARKAVGAERHHAKLVAAVEVLQPNRAVVVAADGRRVGLARDGDNRQAE
jgi:hypothetical protein